MLQDTLKAATHHQADSTGAGLTTAVQGPAALKADAQQGDTLSASQPATATTAPDSALLFGNYGFFGSSRNADAGTRLYFAGVSGTPVAYRPANDTVVVGVLLVCVLLASYVASRNRHAIVLQIKNFFHNRGRSESVALKSESNVRHQASVAALESVVLGLLVFCCVGAGADYGTTVVSPLVILAADVAAMMIYFAVKYGLLLSFNWTFFDDEKRGVWLDGYNLLVISKAVMLLPLALLMMFFELPLEVCIYALLAILGVNELLLLLKTRQIFFACPFGSILSILYFCTLEFLPLLFLWKILEKINKYLLI
jgi:hypothetical protein